RIEAGIGGRVVEGYDLDSGTGFEVGCVTVWEPGRRLALTWTQNGWPDGASSDIEGTFAPSHAGTPVRVTHSGRERGPEAAGSVGDYRAGGEALLGWFVEHAIAARRA